MIADKISAILRNNQNRFNDNGNNSSLEDLIRKKPNQEDNQTILNKISEILKNSNTKKKTENITTGEAH
jgi:hypothetical protein